MDALELVVDEGRPANAGLFFHLGADLLTLLDELSDVPVQWRVADLRLGSAVARVAPPEGQDEEGRWLRRAIDSLRHIQSGGSVPENWSPDAVGVARRLVEHAQPTDDSEGWTPPRLVLVGSDQERSVSLTAALSDSLSNLQPFERQMPGSVRGTLVGLNVSRGNRASLRLPNKRIVRVGFQNSLRGDLKEAMLQPVEVRGLVRQDGDGRVFHVRAEGVEVLVTPEVRWVDLMGIDPNFTGPADSDEYLETSRGDA